MNDLDRFTTDELERMHQRLADTGTVLYQRAMTEIEAQRQIPVYDCEAYAASRETVDTLMAAGAENHELLVSVGREIRSRQGTHV